jgi:hypothetical protein
VFTVEVIPSDVQYNGNKLPTGDEHLIGWVVSTTSRISVCIPTGTARWAVSPVYSIKELKKGLATPFKSR